MFVKYIDNGTMQCPVDMIYYDVIGIPQDILDKCINIDELPIPQNIEGKKATLYCNPIDNTAFYGYEDIIIQVSQATLNNIQSQMADMQIAINMALGL